VHVWYNPKAIIDIMNIVLDDENVDGVIFMAMYASANANMVSAIDEYISENKAFAKPVVGVFTAPPGIWDEDIKRLDGKKGIAVFHTPERAARALGNLWKSTKMSGEAI
jgi:acyl-CoA synthetase (NDP forming)